MTKAETRYTRVINKIKDFDTSMSYVTFLGLPIDIPELLRQCVDQFETMIPPTPGIPRAFGHFPCPGSWTFDAKGFPESERFELHPSGVGTDLNTRGS